MVRLHALAHPFKRTSSSFCFSVESRLCNGKGRRDGEHKTKRLLALQTNTLCTISSRIWLHTLSTGFSWKVAISVSLYGLSITCWPSLAKKHSAFASRRKSIEEGCA